MLFENEIISLISMEKEQKIPCNLNQYKIANIDQRLTNYAIDTIVYFIFLIFFLAIARYLSAIAELSFLREFLFTEKDSFFKRLLTTLVITTMYYTFLEYFLKGKTLGKYVTKTRAVTIENEIMDFKTTIIRSLCRNIPFEPFSFLGDKPSGWHDKLSKTKVIFENK